MKEQNCGAGKKADLGNLFQVRGFYWQTKGILGSVQLAQALLRFKFRAKTHVHALAFHQRPAQK